MTFLNISCSTYCSETKASRHELRVHIFLVLKLNNEELEFEYSHTCVIFTRTTHNMENCIYISSFRNFLAFLKEH